ncbi:NAD(P)H-hydrate dehydratase [Xylophilus rhododendri]|uniref:ADP-dependent (S)-NAD(P)H-hydrate dehydratase n=1 Tax=Xylophilus rhododendri TaxID=2697032 RepID=A0A857J149_9BURK|nr:NAD(P)H-hydrate dehydratase [Xylophilus rhododendri]QHI96983.1 NAD(P)H-hydrate dehydratase [Xylophilus rhododendri]
MTTRISHQHSQPLYDVTATKVLEQAALAHDAAHILMTRAGAATARLAGALAPHARRIWIACGQGNNGGDGFEAAVQLQQAGRPVVLGFAGDLERLPADARWAFERAQAAGVAISARPPEDLGPQDLCIDALLGLGSVKRAAPEWMQASLQALHGAPCPVLAIDVPSGLDGSTGQYAEGFAPPHASPGERHTLSLLTLKPGLFTGQGRDAAGTVWFDDLGIDASWFLRSAPTAWLSGAPARRTRPFASHKGQFGDVTVLGGEGLRRRGMGMGGAALLAGSAALHAGAGRVLVALLDGDAGPGIDVSQPELMLRSPAALQLDQGTVVCGCGGGEAVVEQLAAVLRQARRLVLDADALNAVAADDTLQDQLRDRARHGLMTVLTPHPLEAARLLHQGAAEVQADRLAAAAQLTERYACVVVLKGSGTVIAAPGCVPAVNPTGNGRLATAGTGDVLAGMVGAALAGADHGHELTPEQALDLARDAVYRHGELADLWPAGKALTAGRLARQAVQQQPD